MVEEPFQKGDKLFKFDEVTYIAFLQVICKESNAIKV